MAEVLKADRQRIARGLHDSVLAELTGIAMAIHRARGLLHGAEQDSLDQALTSVDTLLRSIRGTVYELKQSDVPPLAEHIALVTSRFNALLDKELSLATSAVLPEVDGPMQRDLVAVMTEAITNSAKHSNACFINVDVTWEQDELRLTVADNGIGIDMTAADIEEIGLPARRSDDRDGNGLRSMAYRAEQHGGCFRIFPGPDCGTIVEWTVPLPAVTSQRVPAIHLAVR